MLLKLNQELKETKGMRVVMANELERYEGPSHQTSNGLNSSITVLLQE